MIREQITLLKKSPSRILSKLRALNEALIIPSAKHIHKTVILYSQSMLLGEVVWSVVALSKRAKEIWEPAGLEKVLVERREK